MVAGGTLEKKKKKTKRGCARRCLHQCEICAFRLISGGSGHKIHAWGRNDVRVVLYIRGAKSKGIKNKTYYSKADFIGQSELQFYGSTSGYCRVVSDERAMQFVEAPHRRVLGAVRCDSRMKVLEHERDGNICAGWCGHIATESVG